MANLTLNQNVNLLPKVAQGEYPLPVFHFQVSWKISDEEIVSGSFSEVSGLKGESQLLEYRDGYSTEYATRKIPGMRKDNNVTLKRGLFHGDNQLFERWVQISRLVDTDSLKGDVVIQLLGEDHKARVTWTLINAWPLKMESPGLKGDGNEIAVETIELVHEGMKIEHAPKSEE